jgi:hypothetical protein
MVRIKFFKKKSGMDLPLKSGIVGALLVLDEVEGSQSIVSFSFLFELLFIEDLKKKISSYDHRL